MLDRINNICKIEYTRASEVRDFQYLPGQQVFIDADWTELQFVKNADLTIEEVLVKAGRSYETDFRTSLRAPFQNTSLLIIRISFSDGATPMLIGSPDLPVRLSEGHRLTSKTLIFSHRSWHYPYRMPE